ncbi:hypothetical protein AG1IA_00831 [Rhizoctonia solani AG-1 IA]|uniref:Uncharacterized protein n=1 Tax=Thanatephorus cucumeris (strain AG1-IA) TaxID=983506 RepID=L8X909_THACA|nr:hypothetical protein AG1IA_00831 [Rhizoctonia solani AG-1 IA]
MLPDRMLLDRRSRSLFSTPLSILTIVRRDTPGAQILLASRCPGLPSARPRAAADPRILSLATVSIDSSLCDCKRYAFLYGGPKNPGALWSAPVLGTSSLGSDECGLLGEDLRALHEPFRASYQTLRNAR